MNIVENNNGFSPRYDAFPTGLRVLVVDDDPTWLKILEKMCKKCSYEVTTCGLAKEALGLLREKKDGFDIVISDVNMPDMDGFKLLEHVGLEMDLPVIMISVDGETRRVMKGVQHGACDYLLKPIRMKELRNIWQHVVRKKIHDVRDIEGLEGIEGIRMTRNGCDQSEDGHSFSGEDWTTIGKRKDNANKYEDKDFGDSCTTKKARVVWTVDLHQKFVDAVNQIGLDKIGPKKILDLMNVPWLTRENVASHLQKYRLYLSRLPKEHNEENYSGGLKHSDPSQEEPTGSFTQQNSVEMHNNDVKSGNLQYSGNKLIISEMDPQIREGDLKGTVSVPMPQSETSLVGNNPDPEALMGSIPGPSQGSGPQKGFDNSFVSLESQVNYSFDSNIPTSYTWSDVSTVQFDPGSKPLLQLDYNFNMPPLSSTQHHIQAEIPQSTASISTRTSTTEQYLQNPVINLPSYAENVTSSSPIQSKTHTENFESFNPISTASLSMKNEGYLCSISGIVSEPRALISESGSPVALPDDDPDLCWFPNEYYATNLGLENPEFLQITDPGFITEAPFNLYDALRTECNDLYDSSEFSLIGQGPSKGNTLC